MPSSPSASERIALNSRSRKPSDGAHVHYGASVRSGSSSKSKATSKRSRRPSLSILSLHESIDSRNGSAQAPQTGRPISFIAPVHTSSSTYRPDFFHISRLYLSQILSFLVSALFLNAVVIWALLADLSHHLVFPAWLPSPLSHLRRKSVLPVKPVAFPWDDAERWSSEKCTKDVRYYARNAGEGFDIVDEEVETEDGFHLRMHRVVNPRHEAREDGKGGYPVLILHGLFQSSGAFITSEERSLAFWLSEHGGYQVFLGNTRGVFNMGHREFSRGDPRFWDWTIRELAMYDLPALVEYVCDATGYDKIAFIGHSQGNGLAFLSLSVGMRPELGHKLSCFIALAPAVFAGPLTHGFPFNILCRVQWTWWKRLFGVLDFIPLMRYAYDCVPAKLFAMVGYAMFAYLFSWTDTNWLKRRKVKIFRFTPTPVSSASIFWWCGAGGFAQRKCTMDASLPRWFESSFPPLAIYHGGRDYLVAAEPLLARLHEKEKDVQVIKVAKLNESEHCDFYLAAEAVEWCFASFVDDIERTRTDLSSSSSSQRSPGSSHLRTREEIHINDMSETLIDLSDESNSEGNSA